MSAVVNRPTNATVSNADSINSTSEVRRSCHMLMADPPVDSNLDEPVDGATCVCSDGSRTVGISSSALDSLATQIASKIHQSKATISEWDEDGWHYTGRSYKRSALAPGQVDANRVERVLLYILALDVINFCFWPTSDTSARHSSSSTHPEINLLEYEHLATALRLAAQCDDKMHPGCTAEETYAFSPRNLMNITPSNLESMLSPHLPENPPSCDGIYVIPNLNERARLLNELGRGLLIHFGGSATALLQSCARDRERPSARRLVDILISTFRGFRDEAIDERLGRQVCFYKRAQICVGDIWAAFGRGQRGSAFADFDDIDKLTTFADYRVPQLLRQVGVLRYSPGLADCIDRKEEIVAGTLHELYIRGGTVVAVERLVAAVKVKLNDSNADQALIDEINATLIDWHLWQVGERLNRVGELKPHHRTRTIFY